MKILFAQSYFRVLDPKELNRNMPYPPLGTLYAATFLDEVTNHEIIFYDSMLSDSLEDLLETIRVIKPDIFVMYDDEFNYLTKMCLLNMRQAAFEAGKLAKSLGIFNIMYSSDAMDHAKQYLENGYDVVIYGEAELTLKDLVDHISNDNDIEFQNIAGIHYLDPKSGKLITTTVRPVIENIDTLPDPNYNFVQIESYEQIWRKNHGYFSLNISTSRGCPFSCNWCAKPLYGRTYHYRSPKRVVEEIQKLKTTYNVDHLWITDDIFGLKESWLKEFAQIYKQKQLNISYKCLSRVDLLIKGKTLDYLEKTGCQIIWTGVESGSQKILDAMDKGITVEQIIKAVKMVRKRKIKIAFFIQFGYLGEDWLDIQKTIKLINKVMPDDIGISVSYPLPGTKFYNTVKDTLKDKRNWIDSDDLDVMYTSTYPSKFYKILHRYVHARYNFEKILKFHQIKKLPLLPIFFFKIVSNRLKLNSYLKNERKDEKLTVATLPVQL